jgi:hypothetical protein
MDLHTDECIICYERLGLITDIEITPCFHMLHQTCLSRWLEQSQSCPMCRTSIPSNIPLLPDYSWWNTQITGVPDISNDNMERQIRIINFESRWTTHNYEPITRSYNIISEPGNAHVVPNFDSLLGHERVYARDYSGIHQNFTSRSTIEPIEIIPNVIRQEHDMINITHHEMTNFQMESVNTETIIINRHKYRYIKKINKPNRNHMMRMNNHSRRR